MNISGKSHCKIQKRIGYIVRCKSYIRNRSCTQSTHTSTCLQLDYKRLEEWKISSGVLPKRNLEIQNIRKTLILPSSILQRKLMNIVIVHVQS